MNFALPAVVVLLLLLPGFAFRSGFALREGGRVDYSPFGYVFFQALIWAALLHAAVLYFTYKLGNTVRVDILIRLVSTGTTVDDQKVIAESVRLIVAYFVALYLAAAIVPIIIVAIIKTWRVDRKGWSLSNLFRLGNAEWYYLLSGADTERDRVPDLIRVAALVQVGGKCYLYTGYLEAYFHNSEGQLDRLVISGASRRPLEADEPPVGEPTALGGRRVSARAEFRARKSDAAARSKAVTSRFYPIFGTYLVLHYDEVVTLNVYYIYLPGSDKLKVDEATVVVND